AQIDKNDAKPDKRPYLSQTMVFTFETFIGVFVHTTDMRGTFQVSVQIISPGVVWADHDSGTLPFFMNQLHAPVTTDIMKDFYLILVIADDDQRQAHEVYRFHITRRFQITDKG